MTIALIILAVIVGFAVILYNRLVGLRNNVRNAWQQIDVQLKRRYDLIPNLVEVVKDSMSYEQETLRQVIEARNGAVSATTPAQIASAEAALTPAMGKLFAVMEAYPQLKAQDNVARLMEELSGTENKIAFSRQYYNDSVMRMNNAVETVPTNFIAKAFNFTAEEYFNIPETEKAPVKVDLR
ncbi:MAG: rane protein [Alphaproteobacteria bacterium]|nr:rane protein [Alphaproteobacteria bacterium]